MQNIVNGLLYDFFTIIPPFLYFSLFPIKFARHADYFGIAQLKKNCVCLKIIFSIVVNSLFRPNIDRGTR